MATLMRCMRGASTILEPALTLRISNRYVRTVRRRPPQTSSSSPSEEDSENLRSGAKNERVEGADGLKHACSPSAFESMSEGSRRNAWQKHGDTARTFSEAHDKITTSKQKQSKSPALFSKPLCFHLTDGLRYEKAHPDDKRVS